MQNYATEDMNQQVGPADQQDISCVELKYHCELAYTNILPSPLYIISQGVLSMPMSSIFNADDSNFLFPPAISSLRSRT